MTYATMPIENQTCGRLAERAKRNQELANARGFVPFNSVSRVASVLSQMFRHVRERHQLNVRLEELVTKFADTEVSFDYLVKENVLVPSMYIEGWIYSLGEICADSRLKHDPLHTIYTEAVTALHAGLSGDIDQALAFIGGTELAKEVGR